MKLNFEFIHPPFFIDMNNFDFIFVYFDNSYKCFINKF